MAGLVLKVHLTFQIFEYSFLREDLREVPIVGIISPQLVSVKYAVMMDKSSNKTLTTTHKYFWVTDVVS
jgi:hypothetical protein